MSHEDKLRTGYDGEAYEKGWNRIFGKRDCKNCGAHPLKKEFICYACEPDKHGGTRFEQKKFDIEKQVEMEKVIEEI